ncbi:hypothetical protein QOZ80_2AG0110650 [Eleusine coracana subsp. coracana]|nr:hypothetical protein QOZ80_2AG0110650 [Eleusine coracana subsp. coracana]
MEDGEGSAAAFEAALGLNPRYLVDETLDTVDDIGHEAIQYARQEAATEGVLGATKAAQKAAELDRGFNAIRHMVLDLLDKRMTSWERYCFRNIFTLPEGFVLPEDDNSCAKESRKDGTSDPDLDLELDSLMKKLESAKKESENLRRALSERKLDSSIAEMLKSFEVKSVQQNFRDLAKAIPILQRKVVSLKKKRTEAGSLADSLRDNKRLALHKDFTAPTEDIQEAVNILQNK